MMSIDQMACHAAREKLHEVRGPDVRVQDNVDEFLGYVDEFAKQPKLLEERYAPKVEEVANVPAKN